MRLIYQHNLQYYLFILLMSIVVKNKVEEVLETIDVDFFWLDKKKG